jgi:hypothetical protein
VKRSGGRGRGTVPISDSSPLDFDSLVASLDTLARRLADLKRVLLEQEGWLCLIVSASQDFSDPRPHANHAWRMPRSNTLRWLADCLSSDPDDLGFSRSAALSSACHYANTFARHIARRCHGCSSVCAAARCCGHPGSLCRWDNQPQRPGAVWSSASEGQTLPRAQIATPGCSGTLVNGPFPDPGDVCVSRCASSAECAPVVLSRCGAKLWSVGDLPVVHVRQPIGMLASDNHLACGTSTRR